MNFKNPYHLDGDRVHYLLRDYLAQFILTFFLQFGDYQLVLKYQIVLH